MKLIRLTLILLFTCYISKAQSEKDSLRVIKDAESLLVTFECTSCTAKNKFSISGTENFIFRKVKFPLEKVLKPGDYKMTYWQNRVQQIHLPFLVKPDSENLITVK